MDIQLSDIIGEVPEQQEGRWVVDSQDKALWAVGKVLAAEARIQQRKAWADEARRKLDEWLANTNRADMETVDHLTECIRPWAAQEIAKGRTNHVELPGARIGYRKTPDSVDVLDENALLEWCKETGHDECLNVKTTVYKSKIMDVIKTGELPPGAMLVSGENRFYITEK